MNRRGGEGPGVNEPSNRRGPASPPQELHDNTGAVYWYIPEAGMRGYDGKELSSWSTGSPAPPSRTLSWPSYRAIETLFETMARDALAPRLSLATARRLLTMTVYRFTFRRTGWRA